MKATTSGTTRTAMRLANRRAVLRCFLDRGGWTRTELADVTGLAAPTLSGITAELIEAGILRETGARGASTGGRPPTFLALDGGFGHVAGIDLGAGTITVVVVDAGGRELAMERIDATTSIVHDAVDLYRRLAPGTRPLRIGASAPGIVALDGRTVRLSSSLGWSDVALADELERLLGASVLVENDGACAARAEMRRLAEPVPQDLLYLAFKMNIAGALVLGGEIHRGAHGAAAEIGHFVLGRERLGRYSRGAGSASYLFDATWLRTKLEASGSDAEPPERVSDLFYEAFEGSAVIADVRREILENVAVIIANSSALLDLGHVMLGGTAFQENPDAVAAVETLVRELVPAAPRVLVGQLGDDASALGAAAIAREHALVDAVEAMR